VSVYAYPNVRHLRRLRPGPFTNYRRFKMHLQREFGGRCVYCRTPDALPDPVRGYASFGVDHYRPKALFPNLRADYGNLFYACNTCNTNKGEYWPDAEALRAKRFVPNPVDHVMTQHVRYKDAAVVPHSDTGAFFCEHFDLNEPAVVAAREQIIAMAALTAVKIVQVQTALRRADLDAADRASLVLQLERFEGIARTLGATS
jgi:5-methylcytosine-specific restriction endonuclease McrA